MSGFTCEGWSHLKVDLYGEGHGVEDTLPGHVPSFPVDFDDMTTNPIVTLDVYDGEIDSDILCSCIGNYGGCL